MANPQLLHGESTSADQFLGTTMFTSTPSSRYNAQFRFWRNSAVGTLLVLTTLCCIARYFDKSNSIRRRLPESSDTDSSVGSHVDIQVQDGKTVDLGHVYANCKSIYKAATNGDLKTLMPIMENILEREPCDECDKLIKWESKAQSWLRYCSERPADPSFPANPTDDSSYDEARQKLKKF